MESWAGPGNEATSRYLEHHKSYCSRHRATVHFITELYETEVQRMITHARIAECSSCDVPPTKATVQLWSAVVECICWPWVNTTSTALDQGTSTSNRLVAAWKYEHSKHSWIYLGAHHSVYIVTLNVFLEHHFDSYKLLWQCQRGGNLAMFTGIVHLFLADKFAQDLGSFNTLYVLQHTCTCMSQPFSWESMKS